MENIKKEITSEEHIKEKLKSFSEKQKIIMAEIKRLEKEYNEITETARTTALFYKIEIYADEFLYIQIQINAIE